MADENDFGSFAEAITALGTLNKMEAAVSAALATSKVPGREKRKFMKCGTPEEAMNTALFQFMAMLFKQVGLQIAADTYCSVQTWGTPKMILEKLRWRRELIGDFELNTIVNYGGLPFDEAEKSIRLFASQVLPEVQSW